MFQRSFFLCMVGRDINWINLRWFNLGTGAESMTEMYFTVRGFEVYIIRVKTSASSDNIDRGTAKLRLRLQYDEL